MSLPALGIGLIIIAWAGAAYLRSRRQYQTESRLYVPGFEGEFIGDFKPHWEVGRFVWHNRLPTEQERWGPRGNCCKLIVDTQMLLNAGIDLPAGRSGGQCQRISFHGRIVDVGRFGHMGICRYQVLVISDLKCIGDRPLGP